MQGSGSQGTQGVQNIQGTQATQGLQGATGPSTIINATDDTSTTTLYPVMVATTGSNQTAKARSTAQAFVFNASSNILTAANFTSTGQFQSTQANSTTNGGGQIYLNGTTGNRIDFNQNGVGAPAFTTRNVGTKIVLYPQIGISEVDYAFGIDASTLWSSIPSSAYQFQWYAGTTVVATLSGAGVLTAIDFNTTSDRNLKLNIKPIQSPLSKLLKLNGVTFNWKDTNQPSIGVIAQEVEKIFPELVSDDTEHKTVKYNGLIGVLIEAVKELSAKVEKLEKNC
jgi:hypothetical protein